MQNKHFKFTIATFVIFVFFTALFSPLFSTNAQVRAIYDNGSGGLAQQLKRLQTTASAMHTAAHPDDEDSGLLAYLSRHDMARTSYLALNRGEGGQNVIGSELFEPLGVLRSEELLQARRLDGGQQFFTRVMDYGFSKTLKEAKSIWGEEKTLGDMVRAIRLFRPLVVISRFLGAPVDGHGQHQFAGYLTPIAFKAAADPKMFPEQLREGLDVWQAKKLYVSQSFTNNPDNKPTLIMDTGAYEPLLGRSYFEVAAEGRSQHKTQEMGMLELRGKMNSGVRLIETLGNKIDKETDVFDGLDTSIKGIAGLTGNSDEAFAKKLAELQQTAETALSSFDAYSPDKLIPILAKGFKQARDAESSTSNRNSKWYLQMKEAEFTKAIQMAAGIVIDPLSDTENVVAGDSLNVGLRVFAPKATTFQIKDVKINAPNGWKVETVGEPKQTDTGFMPRREDSPYSSFYKVTAPKDAKPRQPYWLENPRNKDFTFVWQDDVAKNLPFQAPLLSADVSIEIGGETITINKDVQYRFSNEIRGELRREVNVVPALSVSVDSNMLISPISAKPSISRIVVSVANNEPREMKGELKLDLPKGWTSTPSKSEFLLKQRGDKAAAAFDVTIPAKLTTGDYKIDAEAVANGQSFTLTQQTLAYPHVQTHFRYIPAEVSAKVLDLKVAPVKVAYIMGSGDKVADAIKRLGLDVTMLEEKDLATGDLAKYDVIVVGIRASQVRQDFVANNGRVLDYVKNGGTLIVQYQQAEYVRNNMLPYPAKLEGVVNGNQRLSNFRVTDENAKVTILDPNNPLFNFPNKITDADFSNWIQERNLYCLTDFDAKYLPLLESHDEGEATMNGGMLFANYGKGKYLYSSYSWFRQLPVGNSGAYRIFANMLSLGAKKK